MRGGAKLKKGDRVKTIDGAFEGIIIKILKSGLIIFKSVDGYSHYCLPEHLVLVEEVEK